MTRTEQMKRLGHLAGLILDLRLSELQAIARARQESLDRLAGLAVSPAGDLPPLVAAQTDLRYQQWADQRRAEINPVLARQTAAWFVAQDNARAAFGRNEVLRALQDR
ncbi:MAG: hypothetical protein U1D35_15630 [Paracoccaceae bacterium]|nr:hypothetical protein [Paracoccaceae bacterium]